MMTMKEFIDQSGLPEKLVKAVARRYDDMQEG
jgi:hypothetical protein